MKRLSIVIVAVLVTLVTAPSAQAASTTPFTGAWTSTDLDGSTQYVTISSGTRMRLTLIDTFGTICGNLDSPTDVFTGSLNGAVDGDTLNASFASAHCGPVFMDFLAPVTYQYDPVTDTLFDGFVTWHRLGQ